MIKFVSASLGHRVPNYFGKDHFGCFWACSWMRWTLNMYSKCLSARCWLSSQLKVRMNERKGYFFPCAWLPWAGTLVLSGPWIQKGTDFSCSQACWLLGWKDVPGFPGSRALNGDYSYCQSWVWLDNCGSQKLSASAQKTNSYYFLVVQPTDFVFVENLKTKR